MTGDQPTRLAIIIVNWNTCRMLRDCLASVFNNLGELAAEVVVVDNGSRDGSAEMVQRDFPAVCLIRNAQNAGFAAANNQGLRRVGASYVLLLNSDTIVYGDVLLKSVQFMDDHDDVGAMGCRVLNADGSMQPTCSRFPSVLNLLLLTTGLSRLPWPAFFDRYQMRRWQRRDERDVEVISGCYLLVRNAAVCDVGLLDEQFFFFGEETDWCRRIAKAGWRLTFAPVGEITHFGGGSTTNLNAKRDMMLSSATVLLHLKHLGRASAAAVWTIILAFHISRAAYWALRSLTDRDLDSAKRRDHFVSLVRDFHLIWPVRGSYRI